MAVSTWRQGETPMQKRSGFSLVEMLVVLAIITILMALYLPVLQRAKRKAEQVAVKEAMRQGYIGAAADQANIARPSGTGTPPDRAECRAAFRQTIDIGKSDMIVTEMLYHVSSAGEFRAYFFTLIDATATGPLEFSESGSLIATDDKGNTFDLQPLGDMLSLGGGTPIAWEFLSTDLSETSTGTLGVEVIYGDGHVEYLPYPSRFPAVAVVAKLSHRFMEQNS
jgi:prepilin-type N-terminal cleavage/methylation domain-containing protein